MTRSHHILCLHLLVPCTLISYRVMIKMIIIIIIKFFNKKVVKRNFTNGEENGVQIIVNNNVYSKLLS